MCQRPVARRVLTFEHTISHSRALGFLLGTDYPGVGRLSSSQAGLHSRSQCRVHELE
jgi:hypothetical protein